MTDWADVSRYGMADINDVDAVRQRVGGRL